MAYIDDLKFLVLFESNSSEVIEKTTGRTSSFYGDEETFELLPNNAGYYMGAGHLLFPIMPLYLENKITMGFWFYSVYPGIVLNPESGEAESVYMPIVDISVAGNSFFTVREKTFSNGQNSLNISIASGSSFYEVDTETYEPYRWHHAWMAYDGGEETFSVYIDGILQAVEDVGGNSLSYSLMGDFSISSIFADIYIGKERDGFSYNTIRHTGYIDDIFLLNSYYNNIEDIQEVINKGVEYFVNDYYNDFNNEKENIFMDDPNMVSITSASNDMSYLFVGRNDGKIMRGAPLLWQVRKNYSQSKEFTVDPLSNSSGVLEDSSIGFLKITNTLIRM